MPKSPNKSSSRNLFWCFDCHYHLLSWRRRIWQPLLRYSFPPLLLHWTHLQTRKREWQKAPTLFVNGGALGNHGGGTVAFTVWRKRAITEASAVEKVWLRSLVLTRSGGVFTCWMEERSSFIVSIASERGWKIRINWNKNWEETRALLSWMYHACCEKTTEREKKVMRTQPIVQYKQPQLLFQQKPQSFPLFSLNPASNPCLMEPPRRTGLCPASLRSTPPKQASNLRNGLELQSKLNFFLKIEIPAIFLLTTHQVPSIIPFCPFEIDWNP